MGSDTTSRQKQINSSTSGPFTNRTSAGDLDHTRAPLLEAIASYIQRDMLPFSTPGHKLGTGLDPELIALFGESAFRGDIPVSGGADSIHFNWETWRLAEELGADAWGADRTFYLVNGSSTGNLATLQATIKPGDEVIVARDVHKSLLVALIHSGAKPVYVAPRLHPELNVGLGVEPADIATALASHPDARMVIVVSPSYCGVASDLPAITRGAHERGVPLYVDEAWGPHFHFHPALPPSAMSAGADAAVASTHKVLGAFTQSAVLHVQGSRIDAGRVAASVGLCQTTSPAAFILATIDACRRQMALHGLDLMERTIALAEDARTRLKRIPGIGILDAQSLSVRDFDLTKLVIDVHGLGLTGFEVETLLRDDHHLNPESSDTTGVICLITVGDTQQSVDRLVGAFESLAERYGRIRQSNGFAGAGLRSSGAVIAPGIQAMLPRDAFFAKSRAVPLAESIGEISAELVIPYPPGIPVFTPGDVITAEKLDYLAAGAAQGMYISGAADHRLRTINIVDTPHSSWLPRPFYSDRAERHP